MTKQAESPTELVAAERAVKQTLDLSQLEVKGGVIENFEQLEAAGELLKEVKTRLRELDTLRKGITQPMDESKKRVLDIFRPAVRQLEEFEASIKSLILIFQQRRERERLEVQRELERMAELERKRLATLAVKQEETGHEERVEATVERQEAVVAPKVAPVQKIRDISFRVTWRARVTDLHELVKAAAKDPKLLHLLGPNMQALNTLAREQKEGLKIPGVVSESERGVAAGA